MKEKISVELERYRDNDGKPTCATNFIDGDVCQFFCTSFLGIREHCIFNMNNILERRNNIGTLIPNKCCLVFKPEEISV